MNDFESIKTKMKEARKNNSDYGVDLETYKAKLQIYNSQFIEAALKLGINVEQLLFDTEEEMATKLENMIELWEDKFQPHVDEYEDMYYILNPDSKKPDGAKTDSALFNAKNIGYLFKRTDAAFRQGYTTAVITKLQYESYNRKSPAIRLTVFYTTDPVPDDE